MQTCSIGCWSHQHFLVKDVAEPLKTSHQQWDDDDTVNKRKKKTNSGAAVCRYRVVSFVLTLFIIVCFVFRWGPTRVPVRRGWMRTAPGGTSMTPKLRFSPPWTRAPSASKWAPTREPARYCHTFLVPRKFEIDGLEREKVPRLAPLPSCCCNTTRLMCQLVPCLRLKGNRAEFTQPSKYSFIRSAFESLNKNYKFGVQSSSPVNQVKHFQSNLITAHKPIRKKNHCHKVFAKCEINP